MKVTKRDGSRKRSVLTGMIVSKSVISRIAPKWDKEGLFDSPAENLIGGWAVNFFNDRGKAPRKHIEGLFEAWAETARDRDTIKLVEKYLGSISGHYARERKALNADHVVDIAGDLFNKVAAKKILLACEGDLSTGKINRIYQRLAKLKKVEIGNDSYVDILQDKSALQEIFDEPPESIIQYPDGLGKFFGHSLARGNFIAFMGPMKRGKTWWLIDMGWRAMLQRRKVAYFQCGDLSRKQMMTRLASRAAAHPYFAKTVQIPKLLDINDDGKIRIDHKEKVFKNGLTMKKARMACRGLMDDTIKSNKSYFRLSCHATSTLSMDTAMSILDRWESQDNFSPDVVLFDYADILAHPPGHQGDSREGVNYNWKAMRRLSLERNCLVGTASQTNKDSFRAESMEMDHFSEDNRKLAHATAVIGINSSKEEKKKQITRLNFVVLREEEFHTLRHVFAAGCLGIANPAILSVFPTLGA